MMKTLKQTSAALMLALAVLASGCAADEEMTTTTTTDGEDGELMTITVSAGSDADTRVAYDDSKVSATDNDALTWEVDDKIIVVGYNGNTYIGQEKYTLVAADAGKKTGSFTGKAIAGATQYNVAYLNAVTKVEEDGILTYFPQAQTQTGDGNPDHLKHNLGLTINSYVTDLSNVQLEMLCSIMKFDLQNVPAEVGTLRKLTWTTEGASGLQSMELAFSTEAGKAVNFSSKQTLTAYLAFSPYDINMAVKQGGKFTVMLEGDTGYYAETTVTNGKSYEMGKRYTATIDRWKSALVVQTTIPTNGGYSYDGLEMQIGTWDPDTPGEYTTLGYGTITGGKAFFPVDLTIYYGDKIWACIPKVAKFFSYKSLLGSETVLTLPDKDEGSTLNAYSTSGDKEDTNDWIVALYMGVNKGGATGADAIPIYWATGNLIATKTNDANSGATSAFFHIATADETRSEATTNYLPTGIAESASDGYEACDIGAQWNKFGWGDATGLKTSTNSSDYAAPVGGGSISGNAAHDIARAKLGGSWRLPTSGYGNSDYELAAFANNYLVSGLSSEDWMEGSTYTGRTYTYIATDANNITNTLKFPAAGSRSSVDASNLGIGGYYWGDTQGGSGQAYSFSVEQNRAGKNLSSYEDGLSVRPVTE